MAAIARRSVMAPISKTATLAAPDDLNGVQDNTKSFDVTGAQRLLIWQIDNGTAGTAGIDVVCYSKDGGANWTAATDLLADSSDDSTGTVVAGGILNAAGVEPVGKVAIWKAGPFEGPTAVRIFRYVTDLAASAAWVTGAPGVYCAAIGKTAGDLTALA
jgi:hypothetical protein